MAATCSLPLHSTLKSWDTGDNQSPARGNSISLASYSSRNYYSSNNSGSSSSSSGHDNLRHRRQHQLPSNGSREMDKVSALGHSALDHSRQANPSSDLGQPAPVGMIAKHGEPNPILKRSYSTPAVRSMAQESPSAAGEKKRNKLGYHRTSIACSKSTNSRWMLSRLAGPPCDDTWAAATTLAESVLLTNAATQQVTVDAGKFAASFPQRFRIDVSTAYDSRRIAASTLLTNNRQWTRAANPPGKVLEAQQRIRSLPRPLWHLDTQSIWHQHLLPSSVGYTSVTGEGLGMPIPAEQNFSVSPGSSLAWGSAEPSPVTLPGSVDMSYGWRPYGTAQRLELGQRRHTPDDASEINVL
ncbi:hypothetical protein NLG97_g7645 [Lecanicillium saksenae]|uniref:Uncharacterized protein n=1 Tax=Lecanicillium saksenae TaxID=468837 RepID=A0ACC1QL71_9HYPO|nr:hypothetical protein NLG97_g7645 [Lecanicillium saksenae]